MVIYQFVCENKKHNPILWEIEGTMSEGPPQEYVCQECESVCDRVYSFNIGNDDITKRKYFERRQHLGMEKSEADEFLKFSIKASKDRMNTGWQQYSRITPNYAELAKMGRIKKLTDKQKQEKIKVQETLTKQAYNLVNQDPGKPVKPVQST